MARPTGPASHQMDVRISHRITDEEIALVEADVLHLAQQLAGMLVHIRRAQQSNREADASLTAARAATRRRLTAVAA